MKRTKRIIISDIHMGTAESVQGDNPYGWFLQDRAALLTEFLNELRQDQSLAELIIAGDLFDEWVVPYDVSPTPDDKTEFANQFDKIAKAGQNAPVITALSNLATTDGVTVSYVPGNHDMLMESGIINGLVKQVHPYIQSPGQGVYKSDNLVVEHGSLYCLFNGPDSYSNPGHSLPLGFFVARSQAEGVTTGHPVTKAKYIAVVLDAIRKMIEGDPMAEAIFDSIVKEIQAPTDKIEMNGIDSYPGEITTESAGAIFKDIFQQWDKEMPNNVPASIAALGETGTLFPAVLLKFVFEHHSDENIVVLGHTHEWEIRGVELSTRTAEEIAGCIPRIDEAIKAGDAKQARSIINEIGDPGPDKASDFIYANSGTWIDGDSGVAGQEKPPATYVVIDNQDGRTSVKVYAYKGGRLEQSELLGERFLAK